MTLSYIIGSIAISYIANCLPTIHCNSSSNDGLKKRLENCFNKAKEKFFSNEDIRDRLPFQYSSLKSFGQYMIDAAAPDGEAESFMRTFEEFLRGDELCANLLIENQINSLQTDIRNYIEVSKKTKKDFKEISSTLSSVDRTINGGPHIPRHETEAILEWVVSEEETDDPLDRVAVVVGEAGCGKTVILAELVELLEKIGIPVVGLKSDFLFDSNETDIDKAVNIGGQTLLNALNESAERGLTVLVIDQVDALSLSLTTRRKPLSEIQRVIKSASENPNIRVVFSCREYDFKNERSFDRYARAKRFTLGSLEIEKVKQALKDLKISTQDISGKEYELLRKPLYLTIYAKLTTSGANFAPSQTLYNALWEYVLNEHAKDAGIQPKSIIDYLTRLTERMVSEQVLSIGSDALGTAWTNMRDYLLSCGFLCYNANRSKIQFFHQTLFDYTVARLFLENNKSIDSSFTGIHQGLFLRSRLKRVLEYQRENSVIDYTRSIKSILGVGKSGSNYRFHLKHLVVTLLSSYETLLPEEKSIIEKFVFKDELLTKAFARMVSGKDPILLLNKHINSLGGYLKCPKYLASKLIDLLHGEFNKDKQVFSLLIQSIAPKELVGDYRDWFMWALNTLPVSSKADLDIILPFVKEIDNDPSEFPLKYYYERLIKISPEIVSDRIISHISSRCKSFEKEKTLIWELEISDDVEDVLDQFVENEPLKAIPLGLKIIDLILDISAEPLKDDIKSSFFFWGYNRENHHFRFEHKVLDHMLNLIEKGVDNAWDIIDPLLDELAATDWAAKHIMAIVGWMKAPNKYKEKAYLYLIQNITKSEHSSNLKYYQVELFKCVFLLLNDSDQKRLIDVVLKVNPDWEKKAIKGKSSNKHSYTRIGQTKAQFLSTIPADCLKTRFQDAWNELKEIERKGFNLSNTAPNRIQVMSGWTTLPNAQFDKMKPSDYVRLAEKYDSDDPRDFESPTRTGNAIAMRDRVKTDPQGFYSVYMSILQNKKADAYYVAIALEALLEAGIAENDMEKLFSLLISSLDPDVNKINPGVVMDICRSLDYYTKSKKIAPKVLIDFVLSVAKFADDSKDDDGGIVDYNTGINRVRGCAAFHLVGSVYMEPYRESIFSTIEKLALSASVATRSATLFQMGWLVSYDNERALRIFLSLTRDYSVNLLSLPAHNLNPLKYLISYDFNRLIPYFEHCITMPETHRANILWLWFSSIQAYPNAERLLFQMGDASTNGRSTIVICTKDYYRALDQALVEKALNRYLNYEEQELGRAYDRLFNHFSQWPQERVSPFLDNFFKAPISKYCSNYVYRFLSQYAETDPNKTLSWITMLFQKKKQELEMEESEMMDVLLRAYNRILVFDKDDADLETAMDLFDSFLSSGNEPLIRKTIKALEDE